MLTAVPGIPKDFKVLGLRDYRWPSLGEDQDGLVIAVTDHGPYVLKDMRFEPLECFPE